MAKPKKNTTNQQQGSMDRLVCDSPYRLNSLDPINAYSFWNQSNTTRVSYWGASMASRSLRLQVHNGQDRKLTYCIVCGCHPKPDEWAGETSRLCIDCGDR